MSKYKAVKIPRRTLSDHEFLCLLNIIDHNADFLQAALRTKYLFVVCSCDWLWFPWFAAQDCYGTCWRLIDFLCWLAQENFPDKTVKWELQWITKDLGLQMPQRKHLLSVLKRKDRANELSGV